MSKPVFKIESKYASCCLPEDCVKSLVDSLVILPLDDGSNFVKVTGGVEVSVKFGPDGNYAGVYAKINNTFVPLFLGANSGELFIFKGSPSSTYPGVGYQVEVDLTKRKLGQPDDQSQWEMFYASRVGVLNTF
jgi:hypothetical protein